MDTADAQTFYAVLYFSALPAALVALIAAAFLRGRFARAIAAVSFVATGIVFFNWAFIYLDDAAERSWQPAWYVVLAVAGGLASLTILAWSFLHPPGRAGEGAPLPGDRRRRLVVMYAGLVASVGYTFAMPALYMLCVAPG
jgi:hypothetical protein